MNKRKFALSFSAGKDSILSLYRLIQRGFEPVALITAYNRALARSWFHGVESALLEEIARSLKLPLILCPCNGEEYHIALEGGIRKAREWGAYACAFGDIDIQGHYDWSHARCLACGMESLFPLWGEAREKIVDEFLDAGFRAKIKCVKYESLDAAFLGRDLDRQTLSDMRAKGIDVCGENGEYHTLVYDGPIFSHPVPLRVGERLDFSTHGAIDIVLGDADIHEREGQ